MRRIAILLILIFLQSSLLQSQQVPEGLHPVNFSQIKITDPFWQGRMRTVATSTLSACILYTETKTGRIRNFEKAAAGVGQHEGIYFDDSDVYKALEAMAYSLKNHPNPEIEKKADEWITKIAAAQLPDGYLNTYYELTGINNRWSDMEKHEDYCAGHLIEAAIAYYNTTGKAQLLDVAIRFANHIDSTFRLANRHWVSGHQEIELALMRLYHQTDNRKYLDLAKWFLEQRGHGFGKGVIWDEWKDPAYCQDAIQVKDQREITGHAVRAMYLYTGAADVAAVTGDTGYMQAMKRIWEDVVFRNMYITGGIGSEGKNEGFGEDYNLPNETAYCETCASVGMVFWNQRMNSLTGNSMYIDVLERSLYNAALDGLSLSGDRFFYGNPLASAGKYERREWFGTACCPSNIARLVSSVGNYIYNQSDRAAWINLYIGSSVKLSFNKQILGMELQTGYPWKGRAMLTISEAPAAAVQLRLRIPGWLNAPVPGELYYYSDLQKAAKMTIKINGKATKYIQDKGYAILDRSWKKGDRIEIDMPMDIRRISSRTELKQNNDRISLQYGPIVYCVEGIDNDKKAHNFILPAKPAMNISYDPELLGGINTITFTAMVESTSTDGGPVKMVPRQIQAIPYFAWNNRGASEMQVWLPASLHALKANP